MKTSDEKEINLPGDVMCEFTLSYTARSGIGTTMLERFRETLSELGISAYVEVKTPFGMVGDKQSAKGSNGKKTKKKVERPPR